MKAPVIPKSRNALPVSQRERGVTMVLVAVAMVAIIAMAALSIDVISLYLVKEEAQRAADAAALAAARVISISGITGDPSNSTVHLAADLWRTGSALRRKLRLRSQTQNAVGGSTADHRPRDLFCRWRAVPDCPC